jgi:hypothetical protein
MKEKSRDFVRCNLDQYLHTFQLILNRRKKIFAQLTSGSDRLIAVNRVRSIKINLMKNLKNASRRCEHGPNLVTLCVQWMHFAMTELQIAVAISNSSRVGKASLEQVEVETDTNITKLFSEFNFFGGVLRTRVTRLCDVVT